MNADAAAILVRSDSPWATLKDLMGYIEANPGKLQMSGTATGGAWDLARAGFLLAAGLPVSSVRWVPAKGSAPSIIDLLGGHIDAVCCSVPEAAAQIEAGQLRVLAVMAAERLAEFPDFPTCKEAGIHWDAVGWRGLTMPKGTPKALVDIVSATAQKIVASDAFKSFMGKNGFAIVVRGSDAFREFLKSQDAQWKQVIEAAGYARTDP
jgi:tripartite-type tricarboxylate transporter receptor subunit TctC